MIRYIKDVCVIMGFVTDLHPWSIDYDARSRLALARAIRLEEERRTLIDRRVKELEENDR